MTSLTLNTEMNRENNLHTNANLETKGDVKKPVHVSNKQSAGTVIIKDSQNTPIAPNIGANISVPESKSEVKANSQVVMEKPNVK